MELSRLLTRASLLNSLTACVLCHSWITCTDYSTKNDDVYDVNKCRGFPRAANSKLSKTKPFGVDTGFDKKPSETSPCQASRDDNQHYDTNHPLAVYYPGQQVVLAHPMKNHGADSACTSIYIPDNGNFLYRGPRNARDDAPLSEFRKRMVYDLGRSPVGRANTQSSSYPKPGYQNAPAFCDNTDKSLGTYSFNVPNGMQTGRYTFIWIWAFNSDNDLYSTCFEVDIVSNLEERNQRLMQNGFDDFTEPCGGDTSNPAIPGNCNQPQLAPTPTPGVKADQRPEKRPDNRVNVWRPNSRDTNPVQCNCVCSGSLPIKSGTGVIALLLISVFNPIFSFR